MAYKIRHANEQDERTIKAIVRAAGINPMGIHWPRFLLADDAGRVVAIGQIKVHGDCSRELASIATVPDRQGEGIASAIIEALLDEEAKGPPGPLYLTCRGHMEPFYLRFGFRTVERLAEAPPYFRRLMRLGAVIFAINRLTGNKGGLVMVRKGK